ncbi:hypothetical protein P3G55_22910 [Leptospira sp. 96542]|nr:hypothetical protein [Leptospira sp. 96542]
MNEPVIWRDGTPYSERFDDVYRTSSNGLTQARRIFLGGCGLPEAGTEPPAASTHEASAWAGRRQWRMLETGFGLGLARRLGEVHPRRGIDQGARQIEEVE